MSHTEQISAAIIAILGPGGAVAVLLSRWQKNKGKDDPVPTKEVRTAELTKAVESVGLDEHWTRLAQELVARINELEKGRDENRDRIIKLERRDNVHLFYAFQLRSHIEQQLAPPPPAWPKEIDPNLN